jgi:hypothetical protein
MKCECVCIRAKKKYVKAIVNTKQGTKLAAGSRRNGAPPNQQVLTRFTVCVADLFPIYHYTNPSDLVQATRHLSPSSNVCGEPHIYRNSNIHMLKIYNPICSCQINHALIY